MIAPEWKQYARQREEYMQRTNNPNRMYYLAAPYSRVDDKEMLMHHVMQFAGAQMKAHHIHVVSPLFMHYSLPLVPGLGDDYQVWGDYSRNLLQRCDRLIVMTFPGWQESTGVQDEIRLAKELGLDITYINPVF